MLPSVADYLVSKGYDAEELSKLGIRRAVKFIDILSLSQSGEKYN